MSGNSESLEKALANRLKLLEESDDPFGLMNEGELKGWLLSAQATVELRKRLLSKTDNATIMGAMKKARAALAALREKPEKWDGVERRQGTERRT